MASIDRCSVEPNCRGAPTGASFCEANWAGSQENALRKTFPRSTITNSSRYHVVFSRHYLECSALTDTEHQRTADQVGRVLALSGNGVVRVRRQIVTQRLPSTVDAAAHGAELDVERGADLL